MQNLNTSFDALDDVVEIEVEAQDDRALLFDLIADLCNHTYDNGMTEVSYQLEAALDALLADMSQKPAPVPAFRTRRATPWMPAQMRVTQNIA
ncbi:hypothetical protein ACP2AV_09545 [Aliiroseovarius sp. PTFE2010]|uniref:hypothetical protein n=1 Tax=Aliiroseovarius sp. PTFE2010 TaxID=3417190 RepID=UPI003CF97EC3